MNIAPFIAASVAANMAAQSVNFNKEDDDCKIYQLLLNCPEGENMTINSNEKIISVNITQNTESYAPQQRRFEASRRLSDSDKDTVYARTLDDILQELIAKYNAKEFTIMPASARKSSAYGTAVDSWLFVMRCDGEK